MMEGTLFRARALFLDKELLTDGEYYRLYVGRVIRNILKNSSRVEQWPNLHIHNFKLLNLT